MKKKPQIEFPLAPKGSVIVTHMLTSNGPVRLAKPVKIGPPVKPPAFPAGALRITLD